MPVSGLIVALLAGVGLGLLALALARVRRRRLFAATRAATGGGLCLLLAALAFSLALNLYTWHRLTLEQPVAQLDFRQLGPERFRVRLHTTDAPAQNYVLTGDQWQLDARVIKWQPWAALLGFDARYQLARLSGRYQQLAAARKRNHTIYDLTPERGLNVTYAAQYLPTWLNPVDARFGSAAYVPMADGAHFVVTLSQSAGLVVRPENAAARAAVMNW